MADSRVDYAFRGLLVVLVGIMRSKHDVAIISLDEAASRVSSRVGQAFMAILGLRAKETLAGPRIPPEAYRKPRRQYDASAILSLLGKSPTGLTLFVTFEDLYVEGLNFVFGLARHSAAIISLHRLVPSFYGQRDDEEMLLQRAIKEAVHEMGHLLGLGHCADPSCVMHFSNTLMDTDSKLESPCSSCMQRLVES